MLIQSAVFYFFATVLVLSALAMITVRNPVHAALFLVLAFFTSAALWLLLEAEFLAIVLVLVYVGAVMVLFLFVVMMLDINIAKMRAGFARYLPLGLLVGVIMAAEMIVVLKIRLLIYKNPYQNQRTTVTRKSWANCCSLNMCIHLKLQALFCWWRSLPRLL